MANELDKNPIVIDVAGTAVNLPDVRSIKSVIWTSNEDDSIAINDDLVIRHAVTDEGVTGGRILDKRALSTVDGVDHNFGNDSPFVANKGINVLIDGGILFIYS